MTELNDIERKRLDKERDNTKVSIKDILRCALDDLDRGELQADRCLLIFLDAPDVGEWNLQRYRSNLRRDQEIAMLAMAQSKALREWEND